MHYVRHVKILVKQPRGEHSKPESIRIDGTEECPIVARAQITVRNPKLVT